eukprot:gene24057-biopygen8913
MLVEYLACAWNACGILKAAMSCLEVDCCGCPCEQTPCPPARSRARAFRCGLGWTPVRLLGGGCLWAHATPPALPGSGFSRGLGRPTGGPARARLQPRRPVRGGPGRGPGPGRGVARDVEKQQRTRTGRGPDAGRTIAFEGTDADRTRTGRRHGRFSQGGDPLDDRKIRAQSLQKHHFWSGTLRENCTKWAR